MLGRGSRSALSDTKAVQAGAAVVERTAETVSDLAARAASAAREAQRAATPALRGAAQTSAETLSHAAERAAGILAEAAQRLAQAAPVPESLAAEVAEVAALTEPVRSGRWLRRLRRLAIAAGAAGAAYVVATRTPLKAKISELVFGPPLDEDEPEPITLPVSGSPVGDDGEPPSTDAGEATAGQQDAPAPSRNRSRSRGAASEDGGTEA